MTVVTFAQSETLAPRQALAQYGKSFNWARRFLGQQMGMDAATLYQFCRVLDDMADGDIADGPARLLRIQRELSNNQTAKDPLLNTFQPFLAAKGLSRPVILALIDGLLGDQSEVRLKDEDELLRYCYRVAGTVGLLMCDVLDCSDADAKAYAIDLGIAMQLTNIARDVLEDAHLGRRYLPESWVGDIAPDAIIQIAADGNRGARQPINLAVERLLCLADKYYESGLVGCSYLPRRAHLAIAVAAVVYRQIGVKIARSNYAWYQGRQFTGVIAKIWCSLRAVILFAGRARPFAPHKTVLHDALRGLPNVR